MKNLVTMSRLGQKGRWGNQIFQYMFVRAYASRYALDYQVPPWIGQTLFGLTDPPVTKGLPIYHERRVPIGSINPVKRLNVQLSQSLAPDSMEVVDHDFDGYAQFHTSYYRSQRSFLRTLYIPTKELQYRMAPAVASLADSGSTTIGLHMRRGDTGRLTFYLTPNEWYLTWLKEHWGRFDNPRLFIATEEPSDVEAFREYNPIVSADLVELSNKRYGLYNYLQADLNDPTAQSIDWFPDWYLLRQCDVLLFGESTFSFSAAMTNPALKECWRSMLSRQAFVQIDPWDAYPLVREHLVDYPDIPGTFYEENPKWEGGEVVPPK